MGIAANPGTSYHILVKMIAEGGQEQPVPTPANPPDTDDDDYDGELLFDGWYPGDNPVPWVVSKPSDDDPVAAVYDPLGADYWTYVQLTCKTSPTATARTFHYWAVFANNQSNTIPMTRCTPLQATGSTPQAKKNDKIIEIQLSSLEVEDGHGKTYDVTKLSIWKIGKNYTDGWPRREPHDTWEEVTTNPWTVKEFTKAPKRILLEVELKKGRRTRFLLFHGRHSDFGGATALRLQDMTRGEPVKRGKKIGKKKQRKRKP